jgi:hypothetical protein
MTERGTRTRRTRPPGPPPAPKIKAADVPLDVRAEIVADAKARERQKAAADAANNARIRAELLAEVDMIEEEKRKAAQERALRARGGLSHVVTPPEPELHCSTVKIGDEHAVYGPGSDHSYLRDCYLDLAYKTGSAIPRRSADDPAAVRNRLVRHARQMQKLARTTDDGREFFRNYYTERNRPWHQTVSDRSAENFRTLVFAEFRADTTAATSMGSFAPPVFLLETWNRWRTAASPAASRARKRPLPATGMTVNVPGMTSGIAVTKQPGENLAVPGSTATADYASAAVVTLVGQLAVSQQTLDRFGPGVTFDQVVAEQAAREAATTLDGIVLADLLGVTVQSITNSGTAGIPALWQDVGRASSLLVTHEGTRLPPDTLIMPPTNLAWYTAQVDKQTRPIWLPSAGGAGARAGTVDTPQEGFSGYTISGADVYTDANLTPTTGDATLVLGNFGRGALVMTGPPIVDVIPEWQPASLTALVRFRQYAAVANVYPKAFCRISGAAYPVAPTFTGS